MCLLGLSGICGIDTLRGNIAFSLTQKSRESLKEHMKCKENSSNNFSEFQFSIWKRDQSSTLPPSEGKPPPNLGRWPFTLQHKFPTLMVLEDEPFDMHGDCPPSSPR